MPLAGNEKYTDCALLVAANGGIGLALAQQMCNSLPGTTRIFLTARNVSTELQGLADTYTNVVLVDRVDLLEASSIVGLFERIGQSQLSLRWLVNAAGVLHGSDFAPERRLPDINIESMQRVFAINTIGAAALLKYAYPLFSRNAALCIAMLSARVGSISDNRLGGWYSYRASKAALNQLIKTAAIELRRYNKDSICIGLHPGTVDTALSKPFQSNVQKQSLFTPDDSAARLWEIIQQSEPADSGNVYAWDKQQVPA